MGLSMGSLIEIFTQSDDLEISIIANGSKHAIFVRRGPGHKFKLMVSSPAVFETREVAIKEVEGLLKAACEVAKAELVDPTSPIAQIVNPQNLAASELRGLTEERISQVLQELGRGRVARTYR